MQVYKYKVKTINSESLANIEAQFDLAHKYHKKLIELANNKRNKTREVLKNDITYQEMEKEIYALNQYIKEFRKTKDVSEQEALFKEKQESRKKYRKLLLAPLKEEHNILRSAIKKDPSQRPFWGTSALIDKIVTNSDQSTPLYNKKTGREENLKFPSWNNKDSWSVGLQLQKCKYISDKSEYLYTDYAYLPNGWFEITKPNDKAWFGSRSERRANNKTIFKLKIGNKKEEQWVNRGGEPVYAIFETVMHRSLPNDCYITNVKLTKSVQGPNKPEWYVEITVNANSSKYILPQNDDITIVDLGWKKDNASLRVMTYRQKINGKWGNITHYTMSPEVVSMFNYAKEIKSRRDQFNNETLKVLNNWYKDNTLSELLTNELKDRCVWAWKSSRSINKFYQFWKDQRYDGDEELFNILESKVKRNKHLHDHEFNLRQKAILRRREEYRVLAAKLSKETSYIGIDKIDLGGIAEKKKNKDENLPSKARSNRVSAATSILRLALKNAFGIWSIDLPTKNSTKTCHNCQSIEKVDGKTIHICSNCGQSWDRDENAMYNYTAYCERLGNLQNIVTAREDEKRKEIKDKQDNRTAARLAKQAQQKNNNIEKEPLANRYVSI